MTTDDFRNYYAQWQAFVEGGAMPKRPADSGRLFSYNRALLNFAEHLVYGGDAARGENFGAYYGRVQNETGNIIYGHGRTKAILDSNGNRELGGTRWNPDQYRVETDEAAYFDAMSIGQAIDRVVGKLEAGKMPTPSDRRADAAQVRDDFYSEGNKVWTSVRREHDYKSEYLRTGTKTIARLQGNQAENLTEIRLVPPLEDQLESLRPSMLVAKVNADPLPLALRELGKAKLVPSSPRFQSLSEDTWRQLPATRADRDRAYGQMWDDWQVSKGNQGALLAVLQRSEAIADAQGKARAEGKEEAVLPFITDKRQLKTYYDRAALNSPEAKRAIDENARLTSSVARAESVRDFVPLPESKEAAPAVKPTVPVSKPTTKPEASSIVLEGDAHYTLKANDTLYALAQAMPQQLEATRAAMGAKTVNRDVTLGLALIIARKNGIEMFEYAKAGMDLALPTAEDIALGGAALKAGVFRDGAITWSKEIKGTAIGAIVPQLSARAPLGAAEQPTINDLPKGSISANIYKDGKLLAEPAPMADEQKASSMPAVPFVPLPPKLVEAPVTDEQKASSVPAAPFIPVPPKPPEVPAGEKLADADGPIATNRFAHVKAELADTAKALAEQAGNGTTEAKDLKKPQKTITLTF